MCPLEHQMEENISSWSPSLLSTCTRESLLPHQFMWPYQLHNFSVKLWKMTQKNSFDFQAKLKVMFLKEFCPSKDCFLLYVGVNKLCFFVFCFIYFWLRWVFVAARRLSLVAASGGCASLQCVGFSLRWLLSLQSTASRSVGFSSCSTRAQ